MYSQSRFLNIEENIYIYMIYIYDIVTFIAIIFEIDSE